MTAIANEERIVAVAAAALERVAAVLDDDRMLILAVCDDAGRPSDLLVRDREGRVAVLAGVPEDRRARLTELVSLTGLEAPAQAEEIEAAQLVGVGEHDLMRTILLRAPLPLMFVDNGGTILHAAAFAHDLGYRSGELLGNQLLGYVHPDDQGRLAGIQERIARGEATDTAIELRWRRRDGEYVTAEARLRAAGLAPGALAGGIVVALRPLQRAWSGFAEVVAAEHRQRLLADASDCGVAVVAAQGSFGVILEANAPLGRIVGMTTGQLVGTALVSLVADDDADRVRRALDTVTARGGTQTLVVALADRVGGGRSAEIGIRQDTDGEEPRELIVRVRDITQQLRLVAELSGAVARLERTNHELAEFARITAHDLSAPLLAASRLLDLIPDSFDDADYLSTLDAIRSAINRMRAMVDGVMGYAESLDTAPERAAVDLGAIVEHALDGLAEDISRRDAAISVGELPTVPGDEHQLERVFLNLISNALKFAGDRRPRVRIESHQESGVWRISVADEGVGTPQSDRARIFELFARSDSSTQGRGIGLATCRRIVELHGGKMWVEPNEPQGSVFNFTLPNEATVSRG